MAKVVTNGYPIFTDADGQPLEEGYVYIGVAGSNPLSNPQAVYWDEGLTIVATGIRTSGGYPQYKGSPGRLYTAEAYSLLVQDKFGRTIYYQPTSVDIVVDEATGGVQATMAGVPVGTVISKNGVLFDGYLDLGQAGLSDTTYPTLSALAVDLLIDNGDGTFDIRDSGFDTGWVANAVWANTTLTITHELNKHMTDLEFEFLVSEFGTDATAFRVMDTSFSVSPAAAFTGGLTAYSVDLDSFTIRTGTDGIDVVASDGTRLTLAAQSWYYKVVVKRRDLPYPGQIKAFDAAGVFENATFPYTGTERLYMAQGGNFRGAALPDIWQDRRVASDWTTDNPVLIAGQTGYETDTGLYKFGDGILPWNSLPYVNLSPTSGVSPYGTGADGASTLTDAEFDAQGELNATTIDTAAGGALTSDRRARATGNVIVDEAITINTQDGVARWHDAAWGGYGHHNPWESILPYLGTREIRAPERPGSNVLAKMGGVLQVIANGSITLSGSIAANGAAAAADDGGSGGGLVVLVSATSILGSGSISVAGTAAGATHASRGGAGGYGGHGGFVGFAGSGGGGGAVVSGGDPALSSPGAQGIFGTAGGQGGGSSLGSAGAGGGGLTSAGDDADNEIDIYQRTGGDGGRADTLPTELSGSTKRTDPASIVSWQEHYDDPTLSSGADGTVSNVPSDSVPGSGGGPAGGGGGGAFRSTSGATGGAGGTSAGGGGAGWSSSGASVGGAGGSGVSTARLVYRGEAGLYDGGQGGHGGGGGGAGAAGGAGGAGGAAGDGEAANVDGWGAGADGSAGANGGNSTGSTGTPGGNGGNGGNGGGAAGLAILIAPSISEDITVTGRVLKITGDEATAFITKYVA